MMMMLEVVVRVKKMVIVSDGKARMVITVMVIMMVLMIKILALMILMNNTLKVESFAGRNFRRDKLSRSRW